MGLTFKYADDPGTGNEVQATARLLITEDDKLVPEGDPKGRRLFCTPGDLIPRAAAEKYGLLKGKPTTPGDDGDSDTEPTVKVVRAWAEEQGIDVPKRGKFPEDVIAQYKAAHATFNDEE